MSATKDPWNPPHLCPCGSSEEFDQWICVHVSGSADAPVWMHASCLVKFARGELESVQIDECELFRSWYRAREGRFQKQNEAMAVIVTQRRSPWEVARQVKRHIDAGEDADTLAKELLAWLLEVADQPMPNPNRCLVEIPDTFAVARWPRDAEVAEIARCILRTLKYEPHTADTAMLRRALEGVIERGRKEGAA